MSGAHRVRTRWYSDRKQSGDVVVCVVEAREKISNGRVWPAAKRVAEADRIGMSTVNEKKAPFRANHVGSLLRPPELIAARAKRERGEISGTQLREVEDRAIRDVVKMQENVGMPGITD